MTDQRRFTVTLMGLFAALALFVTAVGLYAVIANVVAQQRHDIGVRLALGAVPRDVWLGVCGTAAQMVGTGLAVGLIAAWAAARVVQALLFEVSPHDPATFVVVAAVLGSTGIAAAAVPAARAARLDPLAVIRDE